MIYTKIPRVIRRCGPAYVVAGQCDCACAAETLKSVSGLAGEQLAFGTLQKASGLHTDALAHDHILTFLPSGGGTGDGLAVLNTSAWEILSHFDQPRSPISFPDTWLVWDESVVDTVLSDFLDLGFLTAFPAPQPITDKATDVLSVWLHLSERCNLRCDYCYLPHTRADMSLATGRAAVDATFRSAFAHDYRTIKFKYAGGEPLLRFPLILDLHRYAQSLAEEHGINLDGVILSNGTLLTAEMVETIQSVGLRLMISLDGLGMYHDSQRHFPDGRGSFDAVVRAVELALASGLVPDISITVSGRNTAGLSDVVAWVLERDLPFSLNFYREYSQSDCQSDLQLNQERIIEGMLAAYKIIEANLPRRSLLASLVDRANLSVPHLRACGVGQSYLVFDTQGRVAKCQMDIAHPITDCYDPNPLSTLRESTTGIHNPSVDDKNGCANCQWRYWCGGGCPLQAYHNAGHYGAKSPYCAIYQALFPKVIRVEGLRLLKYAD